MDIILQGKTGGIEVEKWRNIDKILAQDEIEAVEKMMTTTENSRTENVKAGNNNKQKEIIK